MKEVKIRENATAIINAYEKIYPSTFIIDVKDGSLIDNYLLSTPKGLIAIVETYETSNSSLYTVCSGNDNEVMDLWNLF